MDTNPQTALPLVFTAARIAECLSVSPQAVRKALRSIRTASTQIVNGNEAAAWSIEQLPARVLERLNRAARRQNYHNVETMLAHKPAPWEPPIPLSQIADKYIIEANKLRDALQPSLGRLKILPRAEQEAQGIDDYARVFGKPCCPAWWWKLVDRAVRRDAGAERWNRIEIYLPDRLAAKEAAPQAKALESQHGDLIAYIDRCSRPPTPTQRRGIWTLAFETYDKLASGGIEDKRAARQVRAVLSTHAPFLTPTQEATLKAWNRKLPKWRERRIEGLFDARRENGDHFEFPPEDLLLIEREIVFKYNGEYARGWRAAQASGKLSQGTTLRYRYCPSRKSEVPLKLKLALGERPRILAVLHRRKRDFNSMKAHFTTTTEGLYSLDCISADDVTLPVYFYFRAEPDQAPIMVRGQCLIFIDLVSTCILGWSLQPDKNYNALVIYSQCKRVFAEKGIPRALLFEKGIWYNSKILTGDDPCSPTETTQGLKELGIEFFHAHSPEGKSEVEKVMDLVQDLMENEHGYCGRDERKDRPDWIKRDLAAVQSTAHPAEPSERFYSFDEWNNRLREIFEEYNSTKQQGRRLEGRSPEQAFIERWNTEDPPIRLADNPELQWLLSAKYTVNVGADGFKIRSGNREFKYYGEELSAFSGYPARVAFDPEFPDFAIVKDMKGKNSTIVPLARLRGFDR